MEFFQRRNALGFNGQVRQPHAHHTHSHTRKQTHTTHTDMCLLTDDACGAIGNWRKQKGFFLCALRFVSRDARVQGPPWRARGPTSERTHKDAIHTHNRRKRHLPALGWGSLQEGQVAPSPFLSWARSSTHPPTPHQRLTTQTHAH